jgi:hypothetical protein
MLRVVTARVDSSRLEAWALALALAVLLAFGAAFGIAVLGRTSTAGADDGPGNPSSRYRAKQEVDAWHEGRWYRARVHSASGERYFITYDGFSVSWNEWVSARRLRPATKQPAAGR